MGVSVWEGRRSFQRSCCPIRCLSLIPCDIKLSVCCFSAADYTSSHVIKPPPFLVVSGLPLFLLLCPHFILSIIHSSYLTQVDDWIVKGPKGSRPINPDSLHAIIPEYMVFNGCSTLLPPKTYCSSSPYQVPTSAYFRKHSRRVRLWLASFHRIQTTLECVSVAFGSRTRCRLPPRSAPTRMFVDGQGMTSFHSRRSIVSHSNFLDDLIA